MAYAPSCSSSDSFSGVGEVDESFEEMLVENEAEDGKLEILLVPKSTASKSLLYNITTQEVPENAIGGPGEGFVGFFMRCVGETMEEEKLKRTPKGQLVRQLLSELHKLDVSSVVELAVALVTCTYSCIATGLHHKLPSAAQCSIWRSFHCMRNSAKVYTTWIDFMITRGLSSSEMHMTLQILLERLLKAMLKNLAKCRQLKAPIGQFLTAREKNAVRYMAGYVAVSLLKTYKRPVKRAELRVKHDLFVQILQQMNAKDQPSEVESLSDYTRQWSEMLDRGGLYHIGDEVFRLIEAVELLVRCHLNVRSVHSKATSTDYQETILAEALNSTSILELWDEVAHSIPPKYEKYSLELLHHVVSLWVTIRGHAFAKDWTLKFEKKYSKGIRKTLKS